METLALLEAGYACFCGEMSKAMRNQGMAELSELFESQSKEENSHAKMLASFIPSIKKSIPPKISEGLDKDRLKWGINSEGKQIIFQGISLKYNFFKILFEGNKPSSYEIRDILAFLIIGEQINTILYCLLSKLSRDHLLRKILSTIAVDERNHKAWLLKFSIKEFGTRKTAATVLKWTGKFGMAFMTYAWSIRGSRSTRKAL